MCEGLFSLFARLVYSKGSVYLYSCANNSVVICTGTLPRSIHALISSSIICLHFTAYCTVACWGDELTYVADADAMLTGEGKGETNTNSLVVNEELMYHAMHTGEDYGGTKTNFLEVNSTNFLDVYDELFKVL